MITKNFIEHADTFFLLYFTGINVVYLLVMILGSWKVLRRKYDLYFEDLYDLSSNQYLPQLTFIIPAYNEEKNIPISIKNLYNLPYSSKQIIIVNDGSKDATLSILHKELDLYCVAKFYDDTIKTANVKQVLMSRKHPQFLVIDKENGGGKYDALNAALNACKSDYYVCIDADTFIDPASFESVIRPLLSDPAIVAIGSTIKISNGCRIADNTIDARRFPKTILPLVQSIEYSRSFLERQGWDLVGGNFVLSGAFNIFRKDLVLQSGGYVNTIAEDMEIVIRLTRIIKEKKKKYKILYLPDPVAWTCGPDTHKSLAKQRANWHRGLLDCIWIHKKSLFNPRYGSFGCFVFPFMIYGEAIEPLIEGLGIIYIIFGYFYGFVHAQFIFLFILVTWGFTTVFTAHCIMIEEFNFNRYSSWLTLLFLILYNALENLGYRQMNVLFRLWGYMKFFKNFNHLKKAALIARRAIAQRKKGVDI